MMTRVSPQTPSGACAFSQGDTSIKVFRKHLRHTTLGIDASQVVSLACYCEWLATRHGEVYDPQKSFQRALTAHVTKSDGRRAFPPEEEAAILSVIRQKSIWPAFMDTDCRIGLLGFRAVGFNERFIPKSRAASAPTGKRRQTASRQKQQQQQQHQQQHQQKRAKSESKPAGSQDVICGFARGEDAQSYTDIELEAVNFGDERPLSPLTASEVDDLFLVFGLKSDV